jgi:hypothetical protein
LVLLAAVALPARANAAPVTINFESFNDLDPVGTVSGATFTNAIVLSEGISLNEFETPANSAPNVASDDLGPMEIGFATPISSFSGYFTYAVPLTVEAFNGAILVASVNSTFSSNLALSGDGGSTPNELLSLAFAGGISSIVITGDAAGGSFTVDDIEFNTIDAQPMPEPATLLLLGAGAAYVIRRRLTRV